MSFMKGRIVRIIVLLWLALYIWGPLDSFLDVWDTPRQQMSDMVRQASGTVVLVAAAFTLVPLQIKKLRDHFQRTLHAVGSSVIGPAEPLHAIALAIPAQPIHAPPVQLRI